MEAGVAEKRKLSERADKPATSTALTVGVMDVEMSARRAATRAGTQNHARQSGHGFVRHLETTPHCATHTRRPEAHVDPTPH